MTYTLTSRTSLKGSFSDTGDALLFSIAVDDGDYFSLKLRSKNSWPLVSIETQTGVDVLEPSAYNRNKASTALVDPENFSNVSFVARVSNQLGSNSRFRLKINNLGNLDDIRDDVIRFTNKKRRKFGLDPLSGESLLHDAAQAHVDDMDAVGRYLGHVSSDGGGMRDRIDATGYSWSSIRENAASGQSSAKEVVRGWMKSPGHRANILADDISDIGVGFAVDDQTGATYWIQKFANPL